MAVGVGIKEEQKERKTALVRPQTNRFDLKQLLLIFLRVIEEEGQESVNQGYRRKVKEHVLETVKVGKKIQKHWDSKSLS